MCVPSLFRPMLHPHKYWMVVDLPVPVLPRRRMMASPLLMSGV